MNKYIIGLDPSSYTIGFCLMEPNKNILEYGTIYLEGDLYHRCCQAFGWFTEQLYDVYIRKGKSLTIKIEDPVQGQFNSVKTQLHVRGSLLSAVYQVQKEVDQFGFEIQDVKVKTAKKVLTGNGNASKKLMVESAVKHLTTEARYGGGTLYLKPHRSKVGEVAEHTVKTYTGKDKNGKSVYSYKKYMMSFLDDGKPFFSEHVADAVAVALSPASKTYKI